MLQNAVSYPEEREMAANKDFRPILTELRRQRWAVEQTTKGHYRAAPPDPTKSVVMFSVSNEPRAIHNTISRLKANGFMWPPTDSPTADEATGSADDWIEEHNQRIDAEQGAVAAEEALSRTETHEERMDRLFHELKDAKTFMSITEEHLVACKRKLEEAERAHTQAIAEHEKAALALKEKKVEFDAAFEGRAA